MNALHYGIISNGLRPAKMIAL